MKRGRKSASELSTLPQVTAISVRRPEPPANLSEAEAATWRTVVACHRTDWFRPDTYPLLVSYCKHVAHSQMLDTEIARWQPEWFTEDGGIERFTKLLAARERETKTITMLARSMRLTQQSQMHARTAATRTIDHGTQKPWEPRND